MDIALVTGSAGLIGSEVVRFFSKKGLMVIGIDNDLRKKFFGEEASTNWNRKNLQNEIDGYLYYDKEAAKDPTI